MSRYRVTAMLEGVYGSVEVEAESELDARAAVNDHSDFEDTYIADAFEVVQIEQL